MAGEIQALFNQYQQKYPLYTRETIIDLMVEDGAITLDIAKKIKSGTSLFLLDNTFIKSDNINHDINMTKILGGNFSQKSTTKVRPKTNFNRKIEPTKQAKGQIDCWLLSGINALSTTKWGKETIYNAILPDMDGSGGVTIKLKGSPILQKNFHITAEEIDIAKKKGEYSDGDDDMIAMELAVEKLFKIMDKQGLGKIDRLGANTNSYLGNMMVGDKENEHMLGIEELLTGQPERYVCFHLRNVNKEEYNKTYKYISNNHKNMSITLTISNKKDALGGRDKDDPVHGNHSYAVKDFAYGRYITISDPYNAGKDIKLSWSKFLSEEVTLFFSFENNKELQNFNNALPENYDNKVKEVQKESQAKIDAYDKEQKEKKAAEAKEQFEITQKANWQRIEGIFGKDKLKSKLIIDTTSYNESTTTCINKYNVMKFIDKYGSSSIIKLDDAASGWGLGKVKKNLILPIINALADKAKEMKINSKTIGDFKNKCNKELDATFYTNEKVIQSEVEKMVKLIKSKS